MSKASQKIMTEPNTYQEYDKKYNKEYYIRNKLKLKKSKRNHYLKNSSKIKDKCKRYYHQNKETIALKTRKVLLKNRYGMTLEEYDTKVLNQKGLCAICHTPQASLNMHLCVDHCHKTGKVRGLLCSDCNWMLGNAKDSKEILTEAINYLGYYGIK